MRSLPCYFTRTACLRLTYEVDSAVCGRARLFRRAYAMGEHKKGSDKAEHAQGRQCDDTHTQVVPCCRQTRTCWNNCINRLACSSAGQTLLRISTRRNQTERCRQSRSRTKCFLQRVHGLPHHRIGRITCPPSRGIYQYPKLQRALSCESALSLYKTKEMNLLCTTFCFSGSVCDRFRPTDRARRNPNRPATFHEHDRPSTMPRYWR